MGSSDVKPGLTGQSSAVVGPGDLASAYGNPGADVMSSMTLMTLLEQACIKAIQHLLGPSEMTVGARMEMDHLAPTPQGFKVTASAELAEVSGRKLVFSASAHDGVDLICRASHVRFLVDKARFFAGVAAKSGQGGAS